MPAISLAYLPLHTITVDGMLETALWDTDKQLGRWLIMRAYLININNPERKSSHRLAATSAEQLIDEFPTNYPFLLLEGIRAIHRLASTGSAAGLPSLKDISPTGLPGPAADRHR